MNPSAPTTILRRRQVEALTGLPRASMYDRIKKGIFTKPISLGGARSVGWPAHEVEALNSARIAGKSNDEIRALVASLEAARKHAA